MKNASQVQYNQQLATCHIHNQNKQGAACDWSDHQILLTVAALSWLAVHTESSGTSGVDWDGPGLAG